MKIREYFEISKTPFYFCTKVCGILFSTIFGIIAIASALKNGQESNPFFNTIFCVILGYLFGLCIALTAFFSSYVNTKTSLKFFQTIPESIKKFFQLSILTLDLDEKWYFPGIKIISSNKNYPANFDYNRSTKEIWIELRISFRNIDELNSKLDVFNKKYSKERLELTGYGIRKILKIKEWKNMSDIETSKILQEMHNVAENESLMPQNHIEQ
jgi:hypothetical protein